MKSTFATDDGMQMKQINPQEHDLLVSAALHDTQAQDELRAAHQEILDLRAELGRSESRTQVTMEMLTEGVLMFDRVGRVVYVNNAASRILSASFDQLIARHARDRRWRFIDQDGTPLPVESHPAIRTMQTGRTHRNSTMGVPKPGGSVTWISVSSRMLLDENGSNYRVIVTFTDITERKIILERLEHQAHHDQLTNLANRRLFNLELTRAISRARRNGCAVALVYMDLNGFKQINDSLGHHSGDQVLCVVAQRLANAMREEELISRYGGDEFVALLGMVRQPHAAVEAFIARMGDTLKEQVEIDGTSVRVNASFGASVYPHDGRTAEQLLSHADAAMFSMKARCAA